MLFAFVFLNFYTIKCLLSLWFGCGTKSHNAIFCNVKLLWGKKMIQTKLFSSRLCLFLIMMIIIIFSWHFHTNDTLLTLSNVLSSFVSLSNTTICIISHIIIILFIQEGEKFSYCQSLTAVTGFCFRCFRQKTCYKSSSIHGSILILRHSSGDQASPPSFTT